MFMLIIKILRYILGYVNFRAFGGFSDRFLNLCTNNGIPLWNISNVKGNISASTTINGYLSIRKSARKSGMKLKVLEKKGLIFFLKRNKIRVGILIGTLVFACITVILSQFIWSISLVGNINLEQDYLMEAFEKYGIKISAPLKILDDKDIAQKVVSEIEELSWASVNRKGTSVVIEVREKTQAPESYDDETPTNLIASEDGVIISIDSLYGVEEVKVGSAVTKGDLLISGVVSHADGKENFIHADGYVKALVKYKQNFSSDNFVTYKQLSEKTRKSLFFFGIKIPLGMSVGDDFFTEHKSFVESENMLLPLGIITEYGADFSDDTNETDQKTKEKLALFESACYVNEMLDFCIIKDSCVTLNENTVTFYGNCEREIGKLQEIYVKNDDKK